MKYYPALYTEKMHEVLREKKATLPRTHDKLILRILHQADEHYDSMYVKTGRTPPMFKTADLPFLDYVAYKENGYDLAFTFNAYLAFLDTRFAMLEENSEAAVERFVKAFGEDRLYKKIPLVANGNEEEVKKFVEDTLFKFVLPIIFVPKG